MAGGRVPEILFMIVFLLSLLVSLYLRDYLFVFAVGLATYTYMVVVGRAVLAFVVLLISLPFQVLVAGSLVIHVLAYYSLVLVVRSLIYLRRSYFIFIPALAPALAYLTLFHPIIEVPPLHYLLVCSVALIAGYFLRVSEELVNFGVTYLEVPELDLTWLLDVGRVLNTLVLTYTVIAFSTSLFFVLLSHGLFLTQSLLASVVAGSFIVVLWLLIRNLILRIALVLVSVALVVATGGFWLFSIFEESLKLFEEVLRCFG